MAVERQRISRGQIGRCDLGAPLRGTTVALAGKTARGILLRFAIKTGFLLVALCLLLLDAAAEEKIELSSRPGIVQPIFFIAASAPVASLILFPGGNGVVAEVQENFLLRVRGAFVAQGFNVAVADAPSDRPAGLDSLFRAGPSHAQDIAAIVAFLKGKAPVPVWVIGTSNGTISAANAAQRLGPPQIAGAVLTSTVWMGGISYVPLAEIEVAVFVIHNRDDGCRAAPFSEAQPALAQFSKAPVKEFLAVSGGTSKSAPCDALSPHGYYGVEDKVVQPASDWIKAHAPGG